MSHNQRITYSCISCNFETESKRDYERHISTQKHIDGGISNKTPIKTNDGYSCPMCHNTYKSRTSIYKHISKCDAPTTLHNNTNTITPEPNSYISTQHYITEVITQNQELTASNQELRTAMLLLIQQNTEFQSKIMDMCKNGGLCGTSNSTNTSNNNNVNSHNTTNSHNNNNNTNNTFNMNMFLNEKCKDAMNMKDFVNSIQLNMTDMENMDRLGYVEGMSTIFIDNLNKTDVYKRPVHCSDMKRETLYVKENDQWEREGPDHAKMTKAVLAVEHKNVVLVNEWANANPRCLNSNTRENEKYFRLSTIVTDGDKHGNIDKVIRKVAKCVPIEKEPNQAN